MRAAQAGFYAAFRRRQHGVARDFRTGAGGRGDGDERDRRFGQRLAPADHFHVVERFARVGHHRRDRLGRIQHTAAAKPDDQIAIFPFRQCRAKFDRGKFRLAGNGKNHYAYAGFVE